LIWIFYRPKFAILDECTSAVSVDIESHLYAKCQQIGTTLITVSHRTKELMKYHQYFLKLNEDETWTFTTLHHDSSPSQSPSSFHSQQQQQQQQQQQSQ
jgi:ABC-type uncharacterized transport system fused permease/ATPase subunit